VNIRDEVQAVIFDNKKGRVLTLLVQKRTSKSSHPHWRLLKGGINKGETKTDALRREILEETGLVNIEILDEVNNYEFVFGGIRHRVSSFLAKADSTQPIKLQKSELAGHVWIERARATKLLYWRNEKESLSKLDRFDSHSDSSVKLNV